MRHIRRDGSYTRARIVFYRWSFQACPAHREGRRRRTAHEIEIEILYILEKVDEGDREGKKIDEVECDALSAAWCGTWYGQGSYAKARVNLRPESGVEGRRKCF